MDNQSPKIGIIGAGKVGSALASSLAEAGYPVTAVGSRSPASAHKLAERLPAAKAYANPQAVADASELVFITTTDTAIPEVAAALKVNASQMVCHVSAADPIEVLGPIRQQGAPTGVFHPLQSFASLETPSIQAGITFAIEAVEPLRGILREMASRLSGHGVELSGRDRVLYHASAVMASNYLVTLVHLASGLWRNFGTREQAVAALLPLIRGTVDNIERVGIPDCLTGPISRGDAGTVKRHLEALSQRTPRMDRPYRLLGLETISVAVSKGSLGADKADELKQLLEMN